MTLGSRVKDPSDNKQYIFDYNDWLNVGETITSAVYSVAPAGLTFSGSAIAADGRSASVFVAGGTAGANYTVTVTMTSSLGQIKQDTVLFVVQES